MDFAIIILCVMFFIFFGIFIYGAVRWKKIGLRTMWIGVIGVNICNAVLQIVLNIIER